MTRRILQGGEDIYPGDGAAAQGARGTQFKYSSYFGTGAMYANGGSGLKIGVIWTPPAKTMILRTVSLSLGSATSNAPSNPGDFLAFAYPSDAGGGLLSFGFVELNIPHTDWVAKGGGSGFNYNAGPQANGSVNGTGPKGTYSDIEVGTSTAQGLLPGSGSDSGSGKLLSWPWSDGSSAYSTVAIACTLTGGDGSGAYTIGGFDVYVTLEGSWY